MLLLGLLVKDCSLGCASVAGRVFGSGRSVVGGRRGLIDGRFGNRVKAIEQILLLLILPVFVV